MVPLTSAAKAILAKTLVIGEAERGPVFTADGRRPISGFARYKADFDKACGVTGWVIHDLRRTAKTLMVRAGVRPDISERVLGHVIAGVEGTYDRHSYADEKRDALEKLAAMIERILKPAPSNVATLAHVSLFRPEAGR